MPGSLVVSTARRPCARIVREAAEVGHRLGVAVVPRERQTLAALFAQSGAERAYRVTGDGERVRHEIRRADDGSRLFVNPRQWPRGWNGRTPLSRAICSEGEPPPRLVVDACAGLGGTAMRIAHVFRCGVTAVEISPPLACLLHYGLRTLAGEARPWSEAASRCTAGDLFRVCSQSLNNP